MTTYAATRSRAFSGVRVMLVRHAVIMVMSAAGTTYLLRELGPTSWGGFATSYLLLVSFDAILSRGAVAGLLRRKVSADPGTVAGAARLLLYAGVLLAGLAVLLPFALAPFYEPPDFQIMLFATSAAVVLYAARALPLTMLERDLRYGPVALGEVLDMAAFYLVAVPLVAIGWELEALALATVARGVVSLVVLQAAQRTPVLGAPARGTARALLPFGLPLCAVTAVSLLDGLIPALVIGREEAEVGFFLVSASLLGYGVSALATVQRVAIPSLGRLEGGDLSEATRRSVALASFLTLSAVIPAGGLAQLWLEPLLGSDWRSGVDTLQLVALGLAVAGPAGVYNSSLTAAGEAGLVLKLQGLMTGTYLALAIAFTVTVGPIGCVVAYPVSRVLALAAFSATAKRVLAAGLGRHELLQLAVGGAFLGTLALAADTSAWAALALGTALTPLWLLVNRREVGAAVRALWPGHRPL